MTTKNELTERLYALTAKAAASLPDNNMAQVLNDPKWGTILASATSGAQVGNAQVVVRDLLVGFYRAAKLAGISADDAVEFMIETDKENAALEGAIPEEELAELLRDTIKARIQAHMDSIEKIDEASEFPTATTQEVAHV